ncbi:MAG: ROK family protein [Candidatus Bipolaricaulia bacterium]
MAPELREASKVLLALREKGSLPIRGLCEACNLSRPTVERIVNRLLAEGLICEDGRKESSGGRRPILYRFNERAKYAIGVDLEIPELELVLSDLTGRPLETAARSIPAEEEPEAVLELVGAEVRGLVARAGLSLDEALGLGLGVPAFLQGETITISGRNLPSWEGIPVKQLLRNLLRVPVFVDNDANLMALSEYHHMGYDDDVLVYVVLRPGTKGDIRMGGGVLIGGRIFHGAHGNAASLQEAYVELGEQITRALGDRGDLIPRLVAHLTLPLVNIVALFDPSRVIINAGILGELEAPFLERCLGVLQERLGPGFRRAFQLEPAQDREFACAKGAALLVLQDLFGKPGTLLERLAGRAEGG